MGYVGAGFVVNQANTTDGGAINTVAYASTGASAGQGVGGSSAVNLYTGPNGTLLLDFINNYYATNGSSKTFAQTLTFTRSSSQTYFDSTGTLQTAAANTAAFDYNPSTLAARGLSMWEARTNSIRNNTMIGAVAGTPGTVPTNWTITTPIDGLSREISNVTTTNGINTIDVRWSGTSSTGGTVNLLFIEGNSQIVAANAQAWAGSIYAALVGGSLTNVSGLSFRVRFNDGAGALLTSQDVSLLTLTSSLSRLQNLFTAANASTAYVNMVIIADFTNSSAVDFTLRLGMPQLELGAFATPVIATTNAAAARTAPTCLTTDLSWFNATEGTFVASAAGYRQASVFNRVLEVYTTNSQNALTMAAYLTGGNVRYYSYVNVGNVSQFDSTGSAIGDVAQGASAKMAFAYKANNNAVCVNGSSPYTTQSGSGLLPSVNTLAVGHAAGGGTPQNGWISSIQYYRQRQPNAVLQALSQ